MSTGVTSGAAMDLSQVPATMPPPGIMPNFSNPDNYKHQNIILHSVVLAITTVAVLVRLYTRAVIKRNIGVDDWLAILSWALALEFSIVMAYATVWGFGMHTYDIRVSEILNTLKWLTVSQKSYFPLILSIKLCILIGYLRIFKIDRVTRWGIWFGVFACTVFYFVTFLIDILRCKPVEAAWNPSIKGKCISYAAFPWATGIFNMISDFYILALPLPPILKMNMRLARRLRIASIFGLGLFTCVASIMRFVVSRQYALNPDQTYVAAKVLHWTVLEINISLICACATGFPAFFDATAPRSLGSLVGSLLAKRSGSQLNVTSSPGSDKDCEESYRSSEERVQGRSKNRWKFLSRPSKNSLNNQIRET
ncbi:hypothetical protein BDV95DRAFT_203271 [Massariosphaeria phaeospora]|uniref:Rhodopsin domain-containing protein n=1 Tax=Massariosphaeria phaeospora TaxID=100035 RepID=A0A7C8MDA8_9PLEO|nr:hypothetical protein BDV95DRAFT_203271 [Massariosphaeria phaeospora]